MGNQIIRARAPRGIQNLSLEGSHTTKARVPAIRYLRSTTSLLLRIHRTRSQNCRWGFPRFIRLLLPSTRMININHLHRPTLTQILMLARMQILCILPHQRNCQIGHPLQIYPSSHPPASTSPPRLTPPSPSHSAAALGNTPTAPAHSFQYAYPLCSALASHMGRPNTASISAQTRRIPRTCLAITL